MIPIPPSLFHRSSESAPDLARAAQPMPLALAVLGVIVIAFAVACMVYALWITASPQD